MTLHPRELTTIPDDIAAAAETLLPTSNPYRILGEQLADVLTDAGFAPLYTNHGRAAISPALLALVTIFQFLEDVPDRQAAEWVRVRLDWKYALHLGLLDLGFDFNCLCYFRQRLLTHEAEAKLFDAVLTRLRALGLVQKRGKQRTDSIAVLGAVRVLSQLETVSQTLRLAIGPLAEAAPDWLAQHVPQTYREASLRSGPDYRMTEAERQAYLREIGTAGFCLLDQLPQAGTPAGLPKLAAVQTLVTVWAQRYERVAETSGDAAAADANGGQAGDGETGDGTGGTVGQRCAFASGRWTARNWW